MRVSARDMKRVGAIVGAFVLTVFALRSLDIRLNFTSSHVSAGIWQGVGMGDLKVGDVVTFSIEDFFERFPDRSNDNAIFWSGSLMKQIAAFEGAVIDRDEDGITVDGVRFSHAAIRPPFEDGSDPCKVEYPHTVEPGHVWLMADRREAYDSRYFGDVPISMLWEKVRPIWIW